MKTLFPGTILLILFLSSCAGLRTSEIQPPVSDTVDAGDKPIEIVDAGPETVEPARAESLISQILLYPPVEQVREIGFRIFPQNAELQVPVEGRLARLDNGRQVNDTVYYRSDAGAVLVGAPGYQPVLIELPADSNNVEVKLEKSAGPLTRIGEISTDHQPKSVRFAPDGESVFVTNLGDFTAGGQYSLKSFKKLRDLQVPPEYRSDSGFVETVILPTRNEIWVSQMTVNTIHVFSMDLGEYLSSIVVDGQWPKVMQASEDDSFVYVSCWDSNTVVEIDAGQRQQTRIFDTSGTPRGLIFSPDGDYLLVTMFSGSGVDRINLETGKRVETMDAAPGRNLAMRHIVFDGERREYYITAMGAKRVYRMSEDGEWLGWWQVGDKPNTCVISPDGSRLFVTCRGPNNPDIGYLYRGYEFGKVYVINLDSGKIEGWIWGRDQPTGLDVSPDGRYLAFSDFLSNKLELYLIN